LKKGLGEQKPSDVKGSASFDKNGLNVVKKIRAADTLPFERFSPSRVLKRKRLKAATC